MALAETDVRFLPLPPAFNARPYTMYSWVHSFGFAIVHAKDLWQPALSSPESPVAAVDADVRSRLREGWSRTAPQLVNKALAEGVERSTTPGFFSIFG